MRRWRLPRWTGIRLNSRLWPVLVVILLVLQILFPFKGWLILFVGLGGAFGISLFWVVQLHKGLWINRQMRYGWAQVGDILEEQFELINNSLLPALWVEVIDHSNIPGYEVSRATGVGGESTNEWRTRRICAYRGLYTLGPTTLHTGDPFGIYTVEVENPASATLLITPPILPIPHIQVATGGRAGEGQSGREIMEQTVSSAGVRDYHPGDRLYRIHWPTSVRRNSLFVKTFDSTPASDWWIVLDLDEQTQAGSGPESTEETAVILAASLADRGLRAGVHVGLIGNGKETVWISPGMGDGQRWEILRALATIKPGSRSLAELFQRAQPSFRSQSSLVLITSAVDGRWLDPLLTFVWRGMIPTVILLNPEAFGGHGQVEPVARALAELEISRYIITPDMLESPDESSQEISNWDFRIMPTGKAIPVRKPRDAQWKGLL